MAVNPHKGDLPFEAGGEHYVLCYSHRSLVLLEEKLDKGLMRIIKEIDTWKTNPEDMRLGTICALLWAGLQKHHPTMTMDGVSEIMDDLDGGASRAIELLGEGFQRAFSAPGTKGTNPPLKTENGSGTGFTSSTPVSDTIPTNSGRSLLES